MKNIFYGITLAFLFNCSNKIEIEIPQHTEKPVVNAILISDSSMYVYINWSKRISDKTKKNILYDSILLLKDTEVIYSCSYTDEIIHSFNKKLQSGIEYELRVYIDNKILSSKDVFPYKNEFLITRHIPTISISEYSNTSLFEVKFTDSITPKKYYEIDVVVLSSFYKARIIPISKQNDVVSESQNSLLFTNSKFENSNITLNCYVVTDDSDSLYVFRFKQISRNYYEYQKSLSIHLNNIQTEGDLWRGAGNPSVLYSNIEGGYGIFASFQQSTDSILIPKN